MPSELKPTTQEEREALKHHSTSEMLLPAPYYWQTILRLIADLERLTNAVRKHRLDIWGDGDVGHQCDVELYKEALNAE